jgi:hypothetical protein
MPIRSRAYTAACLCIGAGVAAASLFVASREWFHGDDFAFLWFARQGFDPLAAFLPTGVRVWPTYRPLTIEVYFAALQRAFGLNPFPFLALSLGCHFAGGFVVARIARQLGLDARLAGFAGVLSIAMYPSLSTMFWASAFQHVAAILFCLLCIASFLAFLERSTRGQQGASCLFLALALLSNELAASLPGVLALLAFGRAQGALANRMRYAALRVAPQAVLLVAYLGLRFGVITQAPMHPAYALTFGWNLLENGLRNLSYLLQENWLFALGVAALVATAQLSRPERGRSGILLGWIGVAALPTLGMPEIVPRMTMNLEAPFALLLADQLAACLRRRPALSARWIEAGLVALLLLAIPYGVLYERGTQPEGALNRKLARSLQQHFPALPPGSCVAIRLDPALDWDDATLYAWRYRAHNLLSSIYGNDTHELLFDRASDAPQRRCPANFQLAPPLQLTAIKLR